VFRNEIDMVSPNRIAEVAAVIGEPARAAMLTTLMDGRALTASELARVAGITPQTASTHLARLISTDLIKLEKQGRSRYHRLASPSVARLLEELMQHATSKVSLRPVRTGPRDEALRQCRSCYDHIAGSFAVAIADALVARGHIEIDDDVGIITTAGVKFLARAGIVLPEVCPSARRISRPLCRPCLDWSERRPHFAGQFGAALRTHCFEAGWLRRIDGSRALSITPKGHTAVTKLFGIPRLRVR
jgi:DNA-binding transcriptional ArsR family regulator